MIKIFHTGDLHLDSAFCRLSHDRRIEARKHQRDIFLKMIKYVSEGGFDMLLISGDLFDGKSVSPETEDCVAEAFASLACPVVISPGNHDPFAHIPLYSSGRLHENVFVFNSEEMQVLTFDKPQVQVCGYAFVESNTFEVNALEGFVPPTFDGVSVLCAHGELNAPASRTAPISSADIARCGFAYAALGHAHTSEVTKKDASVISYCGIPEGRAFDETGDCGAMAVTIDGGKVVSAEKIIFGERRFVLDSFDADGATCFGELIGRLLDYIKSRGYNKSTALRLTVTGEVDMSFTLDVEAAEEALGEILMFAEVIDKTYPRIDERSLEADFTLRGEVYRVLRPQLDSQDSETRRIAAEALRVALLAIDGRDIK